MPGSVFLIDYHNQQRVLGELLRESSSRSNFYFLLTCSAVIATIGLLVNNPVFVIGGMLVAPILFPVLSLAMAVVTFSRLALYRSIFTLIRATGLIILASFLVTLLAGWEKIDVSGEMFFRVEPNLLFFFVALAAGSAVSYTWIKQDLSAALPGVAVSVSLVPPLTAAGIGLAFGNTAIVTGAMSVFLIDLIGIVASAILIFFLFGFSDLQELEEQKIVEEKLEEKIQKQAVQEAKVVAKDQPKKESPRGDNPDCS